MQNEEAEELTKEEEKEEQERDTQHYAATAVRERLYDLISAADTMAKVKRVYRRLEGFQKSDSLGDSDILDKLQKIDPIIDEIQRPRRLYQTSISFMSKSRRLSFCIVSRRKKCSEQNRILSQSQWTVVQWMPSLPLSSPRWTCRHLRVSLSYGGGSGRGLHRD